MWGPGPYQGTLNTLLGIYLAFTMPPICYPTAHVVKARPKALHITSGLWTSGTVGAEAAAPGGTSSQRSPISPWWHSVCQFLQQSCFYPVLTEAVFMVSMWCLLRC